MAISQHSVVFVTFTHFGTSSETLSEGLPPGRRSVSSELERTASGQHHAPGQRPWEGGMSDGTADAPRPVTRTPRPVLPDSLQERERLGVTFKGNSSDGFRSGAVPGSCPRERAQWSAQREPPGTVPHGDGRTDSHQHHTPVCGPRAT